MRSQLGNFGQVPYGSSIVGKVLLQKNTDGTNLWCDYSKTVSIPQTSDEYVPIILVDQYKELILLNVVQQIAIILKRL